MKKNRFKLLIFLPTFLIILYSICSCLYYYFDTKDAFNDTKITKWTDCPDTDNPVMLGVQITMYDFSDKKVKTKMKINTNRLEIKK